MTTKPKLLTADDLLELYNKGVRGELIQGCSARSCRQVDSTER